MNTLRHQSAICNLLGLPLPNDPEKAASISTKVVYDTSLDDTADEPGTTVKSP